jgi:predicted ATP-dependent serine protease
MLEIKANSDYMKPVILIKTNNSEVLTSNSICLLKGISGSGKSRLVMNIMVGLSGASEGLNLEYTECPKDKYVLYFSTEMSPYHLQRRLLKILCITGKEYENNLKFFDINAVKNPMEEINSVCEIYPPYVIIIDQAADLVMDFNNIEQSKKLLNYLNLLIMKYNASIVAVVHQNEDGNLNSKARGHLGSFLEQKSVCSIGISKQNNNLFKMKSTKMREGAFITINAEYDLKTEMLKEIEIAEVEDIITLLNFPMDATALINAYKKHYKKSESYVRKIIKTHVNDDLLFTTKQGKEIIYNKTISQ